MASYLFWVGLNEEIILKEILIGILVEEDLFFLWVDLVDLKKVK